MRAEVFFDRDGVPYYRCPLCGMVFRRSKDYTRHLNKSHSVRNASATEGSAKKEVEKQ